MKERHLYLIGIGGVGMMWIADYALKKGWKLSGSDLVESSITKRLMAAGANIHIGSNPSQIPADVTEAVITSAATADSPSYPEVEELKKRGVPIRKRAEWLGSLTKEKYTIAVSGSHGKTTTTAMIGWILEQAGLDPTVFVGGEVIGWNGTRVGEGKYLVIEADEFDRSFHHFYPQIAVVLNIDLDHTDYYTGGMPEIEHAYRRFLRNLPHAKGMIVGYGRNPHVRKAAKGFKYAYRWYDEESIWANLKLTQPGLHYKLNATAAARVAHEIGVEQKTILKALSTFPGTGRRLEYLGKWHEVELYDDYAHHPEEIKATLKALREKYADTRLVLIYQPHQKARTLALLKEFGRAFDEPSPDELILAPIYNVAGREEDIQVSHHDIATEIAKKPQSHMQVTAPKDLSELHQETEKAATTPGIMVIMGAGDIRTIFDSWR